MTSALAERLDAALPQTQCTRCGYPDCRSYAQAIAHAEAGIDRCPPGGAEGIRRLASLTGRPVVPLNPDCGEEGPLQLARIVEADCIGCTLCLKACPVDAIVGAAKQLHQVIAAQCTGCALCLPPCPVDCIRLEPVEPARTGWAAWSPAQAQQARQRYEAHQARLARTPNDAASSADRLTPAAQPADPAAAEERRQRLLAGALARARARTTA